MRSSKTCGVATTNWESKPATSVYASLRHSTNSAPRSDRKANATPVRRAPRSINATVPGAPGVIGIDDENIDTSIETIDLDALVVRLRRQETDCK